MIIKPKKFYKEAKVAPLENGFAVLLDGKNIKTPGQAEFVMPTLGLARAVADEWQRADAIDYGLMPLTQLAFTFIDRVFARRDESIDEILSYAASDQLCYWATEPDDLVKLQKQVWQPLMTQLEKEQGLKLNIVLGLLPQPQPQETEEKLKSLLEKMQDWDLALLSYMSKFAGSTYIAYLWRTKRWDGERLLETAFLQELYRLRQSGDTVDDSPMWQARLKEIALLESFRDLLYPRDFHKAQILVSGRVQGVGYRAWVLKNAQEIGLAGWVRNLSDGRVEAEFEGAPEDVSRMIQRCLKGPMMAKVSGIEIADFAQKEKAGSGFTQLPTL